MDRIHFMLMSEVQILLVKQMLWVKLKKLGWNLYNDLDQFGVGYPNYWRDYDRLPNVATEHTMYTNTEMLYAFSKEKRKLTNVDKDGVKWNEDFSPWKFKDGAKKR